MRVSIYALLLLACGGAVDVSGSVDMRGNFAMNGPGGAGAGGGGGGGGSAPTVTSLTPSSGSVSDGVTIAGTNFVGVTGVDFNGSAASFTVASSTQIVTTVPNGATTGLVTVTTSSGSAGQTFTVIANNFAFDLTRSTLPAAIVPSRTGSDVYAQSGAMTASSFQVASNQGVYEDKGDGGGGGWWTFAGYQNYVTAPFDASAAFWSHDGTPTITTNDAVAPDGTTTADSVITPAGEAGIFSGAVGPSDANPVVSTLWVKDAAGATPSSPGVLAIFDTYGASGIASVNRSLGTGAAWRNLFVAWAKGTAANDFIRFAPAGAIFDASNNVTFDAAATGGVEAWGAQTTTVTDYGIKPLVNGTTGAATLSVATASLADMFAGGDFHIETSYLLDPYFTEGPVTMDASSPYIWSMHNATDGDTFVRLGSQTVVSYVVNGNTAAPVDLNIGSQVQGTIAPSVLKVETWDRPSDGKGGMQIWINGVVDAVAGRNTFVAVTMTTPSSFYLGSNNGTGGYFARRWTQLRKTTASENRAEALAFGDSITATYSGHHVGVFGWVYTVSEALSRTGIVTYAYPGERVDQQQGRYDAAPQFGSAAVRWIYVNAGVNDVLQGATAATVTTRLQAFVTDLNANNPSAKILLAPITPCKANASIGAGGWTTIQTINANIEGTGGTPITGTNLVIMPLWSDLDDGSGNLKSQYDSGDGLHENDAGGRVIAADVRAKLIANGLL